MTSQLMAEFTKTMACFLVKRVLRRRDWWKDIMRKGLRKKKL